MPEFIKVARTDDVKPGKSKALNVGGVRLALFNVGGTFYCVEDSCSHQGAPLASGMIGGKTITCEWHGATFDLETGKGCAGPAGQGIQAYKVRVVDDHVEVEV